MHRRDRARCRRPPGYPAQHGHGGPVHRGDLLCRAGACDGRCRQLAPDLLEDVPAHRDQPSRRRDMGLAQQAKPRRSGHRGRPSRHRQCRQRAPHAGGNRSPALPRPGPHACRGGRIRPGRHAFRHRRLHARSDRVAPPRRTRAGGQESERHLLDDRRPGQGRRRPGDRPLPASGNLQSRAHPCLDPQPGADAPCRDHLEGGRELPDARPLSRLSGYAPSRRRGDRQDRARLAIGAVAAGDLRRFPDLLPQDQRRRRSRHRPRGLAGAGISESSRHHRRSGGRQRARLLLRAGPAAHARTRCARI